MADELPIPTIYKTRLRSGISYPIGAEIVSEVFGSLTPGRRFELRFYSPSTWNRLSRQGLEEYGEPFPTLHLSRADHFPGISTSNDEIDGFCGERWHIIVYAVPSARRALARRLLVDGGLAEAFRWMVAERPALWKGARRSFSVFLDPKLGTLTFEQK